MRSIRITIPEELDAWAVEEARRRGVSMSELIRIGLDVVLSPSTGPVEDDLWHALAGFGSGGVSAQPGEIGDVVYGA